VTAIWLLHPLNLTTTLYVVQRMTSLSALFTVLGLALYVTGRTRQQEGRGGFSFILGGIIGCGALALMAKENGALLPLYALVVEWSLFRFAARDHFTRRSLIGLFVCLILIPACTLVGYTALHPEWLLSAYRNRSFLLSERLLTEARILWTYIRLLVAPSVQELALYHDDIPVSRGLMEPVSTLWAVIGLGMAATTAIALRARAPMVSLGILWFFAGHLMESSFIGLELMHEHRNYLPELGILMALLSAAFGIGQARNVSRFAATAVVTAACAALWIVTFVRAGQYGNEYARALYEVRHHPDSARANYEAGRALAILLEGENAPSDRAFQQASTYFLRSAELSPQATAGLFALVHMYGRSQKPADGAWLTEIKHRLEQGPYAAESTSLMVTLVRQARAGKLKLSPEEVTSIFEAALRNPGLSGEARAVTLSSLGSYRRYALRDYGGALELTYQATVAAPRNAVFNMIFARLLLAVGNIDGAKEQIDYAALNDGAGIWGREISDLRGSALKPAARLQ
jgi:tetratricopeptide (TPR) repeat protein